MERSICHIEQNLDPFMLKSNTCVLIYHDVKTGGMGEGGLGQFPLIISDDNICH